MEEDKSLSHDDVLELTYTVTDQQVVVDVVTKIVEDSFAIFPRKDSGDIIENPSREGGNHLCDEANLLVNGGLEQNYLMSESVENVVACRLEPFKLSLEASKTS